MFNPAMRETFKLKLNLKSLKRIASNPVGSNWIADSCKVLRKKNKNNHKKKDSLEQKCNYVIE